MTLKMKSQMTQQMVARTIHGRFVNWKGGKGGNSPNDLKQQHLVKFTKKLIRGMGAQKNEKAVNRTTSAACGLHQIIEQFDKVSNVLPESTAHTYRNAESDIRDMIQIIQDLQVFDKKPGRASVTRFCNFYYQIRLDALRPPPLLYILQCLEQEGVLRPNLSSCGNKICIYGHVG